MKKSTIPILKRIIFCVVFILLFSLRSIVWSESSDYWPNQGWRISTPEEQGMSSEDLADMISIILYAPINIDSVTVIRNGYVVLDAYFYPFQKNSAHIIHSCTKSITSTLIGIAIDKGYIKDVHHRLLDFFPELSPDNMTEEKKVLLLKTF